MKELSIEQIESIFREMQLGTEEEREHFIKLGKVSDVAGQEEAQIFIRLESTTELAPGGGNAELE
ncbi:MAG: hypothetical protein AB7P14_28860 [Blastocatellales bacterium]